MSVITSVDRLPAWLRLCLGLICVCTPVAAQTLADPLADLAKRTGSISGIVQSDSDGGALRRAVVSLKGADDQSVSRIQTTDESGRFEFQNVASGAYSISVTRDGYLQQTAGRIGAYKMPPIFILQPGQDIGSFTFRMTPWGVITGRIKFDDAEPAVNVSVELYQQYFLRGRHGWSVAARTRTDDRGEYRVHGLQPGSYYVAAMYQSSRPADAVEERRTDAFGKPLPEMAYAVTFYPDALKLADAVAVRLSAGQEIAGINMFLAKVHTVRIRGRVISALGGGVVEAPSITMRWNDIDNTASVSAPVDVSFDRDHHFEIRGVTPGPYVILTAATDDGKALLARTPIPVGESDVDELTIVAGPPAEWKGQITVESDTTVSLGGLVVEFEPRRATAVPTRSTVEKNGEFKVPFLPQEVYDVNVLNMPADAYLKSAHVGAGDRLSLGLEAPPGDNPAALQLVISTHGGKVLGRAVEASDSSVVATGAAVLLIPDPPVGRWQAYRSSFADQYGNFLVRGVPPGNYVAVAWFDQPPCDVYNPDAIDACKAAGVKVSVSEDGLASIQITAH